MNLETIAVFGGSGKVGSRVIKALQAQGKSVRALIHRTPITGEGIESIPGNVTDPEAVRQVVDGADAVVQMATAKEDPDTFFDVSIRGTFNVLEACTGRIISDEVLRIINRLWEPEETSASAIPANLAAAMEPYAPHESE